MLETCMCLLFFKHRIFAHGVIIFIAYVNERYRPLVYQRIWIDYADCDDDFYIVFFLRCTDRIAGLLEKAERTVNFSVYCGRYVLPVVRYGFGADAARGVHRDGYTGLPGYSGKSLAVCRLRMSGCRDI